MVVPVVASERETPKDVRSVGLRDVPDHVGGGGDRSKVQLVVEEIIEDRQVLTVVCRESDGMIDQEIRPDGGIYHSVELDG